MEHNVKDGDVPVSARVGSIVLVIVRYCNLKKVVTTYVNNQHTDKVTEYWNDSSTAAEVEEEAGYCEPVTAKAVLLPVLMPALVDDGFAREDVMAAEWDENESENKNEDRTWTSEQETVRS